MWAAGDSRVVIVVEAGGGGGPAARWWGGGPGGRDPGGRRQRGQSGQPDVFRAVQSLQTDNFGPPGSVNTPQNPGTPIGWTFYTSNAHCDVSCAADVIQLLLVREKGAADVRSPFFYQGGSFFQRLPAGVVLVLAGGVSSRIWWAADEAGPNMKARVPSSFMGLRSAVLARSGLGVGAASWTCSCGGLFARTKLRLCTYSPWMRPMNSFMKLRWNHGGRKVCSATISAGRYEVSVGGSGSRW